VAIRQEVPRRKRKEDRENKDLQIQGRGRE
jgi:hypothetical protein